MGVLSFVTVIGLHHKEIFTDLPLQRLKKSWPVFVCKGDSAEWKNGKHRGWAKCMFTFQSLALSICTTRKKKKKFYMVLALCRVFCVDFGTDSELCFISH
jgi:hypothetical protein